MSAIDSTLTIVWEADKAKFGIIRSIMMASSSHDIDYLPTKCFYKASGGSITLSQGNTTLQQQESGLVFLDSFVQGPMKVEVSSSDTVSYLIVESRMPGVSNIETVTVNNTYTLQATKYAALVEGSITINNGLPNNVVLFSGNTNIELSQGDTLLESAAEFPILFKVNNNTTLSGNGSLIIFNEAV